MIAGLGATAVVACSASAMAAPPPTVAPMRAAELTAADVAAAPLPGNESGRIDHDDSHDGVVRVVARGLLFLPKLLLDAAVSPIHGLAWVNDHYDIVDLYYRTFFNAARTIGLFPTATYATGFGADVGMRFEDLDLFGEHERLAVQATTGAVLGEHYREGALVSFRSGDRISHWFELGIDASFDRRPSDPFDGIGNGNLHEPPPSAVDPQIDDTAVETYYRYQEVRLALIGDARLPLHLHVIATGSLADLRFATSTTGPPIGDVYDAADLVGFRAGVRHAYGQLELRWDTRRQRSLWEPRGIHAAGSLVAAYAGRVDGFDGEADFWRYGAELQHFWPIANGPRVIIARFRLDAVTGSLAQVPFSELPTLGGGEFLRGYAFERFRDRVAALASFEYQWDLSHFIDAHVFADVGRVFPSIEDLSIDHPRVGYGVGLELHGEQGDFELSADLASSTDGGVFASVSVSPVLDAEPRWR